jgi:hypothetical protein
MESFLLQPVYNRLGISVEPQIKDVLHLRLCNWDVRNFEQTSRWNKKRNAFDIEPHMRRYQFHGPVVGLLGAQHYISIEISLEPRHDFLIEKSSREMLELTIDQLMDLATTNSTWKMLVFAEPTGFCCRSCVFMDTLGWKLLKIKNSKIVFRK